MATILNKAAAVVGGGGNTGFPKSIHNPGLQIGGLLIPKGAYIPYADSGTVADVLAWLKTQMYEDRALRIFTIGRYQNIEKKGSDRATESFNDGSSRTVRRGKIGHQFLITNGGKWYHTRVFNFDGLADLYDYLPFDDKGNLIGVKKDDGAGNKVMGGRSLMDFYVGDWEEPNGSTSGRFMIDVEYADSNEINRDYSFMALGVNLLSALTGLGDVELTAAASATANVLKVTGTMDEGETDLYDYYAALLAQGAVWSVIDPATNLAVTLTGAAGNAAIKGWNITLATGGGSNNPGTGNPVLLTLKSPKLMSAAGTPVYGIEAVNVLEILVP